MTVLFKIEKKYDSERFSNRVISLVFIIIALIILMLYIQGIFKNLFEPYLWTLLVSPWVLVVYFFIISFYKEYPGVAGFRLFTISEEEIIFKVPTEEDFIVKWSEIDEIHVEKYKIYFEDGHCKRTDLVFKGINSKTFTFKYPKFKRRHKKRIIKELEKYSPRMNKTFIKES